MQPFKYYSITFKKLWKIFNYIQINKKLFNNIQTWFNNTQTWFKLNSMTFQRSQGWCSKMAKLGLELIQNVHWQTGRTNQDMVWHLSSDCLNNMQELGWVRKSRLIVWLSAPGSGTWKSLVFDKLEEMEVRGAPRWRGRGRGAPLMSGRPQPPSQPSVRLTFDSIFHQILEKWSTAYL